MCDVLLDMSAAIFLMPPHSKRIAKIHVFPRIQPYFSGLLQVYAAGINRLR